MRYLIKFNESSFPERGFKKISEEKLELAVFGPEIDHEEDFFRYVDSKWEELTEREINFIKNTIKSKRSTSYTYEYKYVFPGEINLDPDDLKRVPNNCMDVFCYMISLDRKSYIDSNGYNQKFGNDDLPFVTTPENMIPYLALKVYKMKDSWYYINNEGSDERYVCDQYDGFKRCLQHIEKEIIRYM